MSRKKKQDFLDIYEPVSKKVIIEEQDRQIECLEDYCKQLEKDLEAGKKTSSTVKDLESKLKKITEKYNTLLETALLYRQTLEYYGESQNYCKNTKINDRWWYGILEDRGNRAKTALSHKLPGKQGKNTL